MHTRKVLLVKYFGTCAITIKIQRNMKTKNENEIAGELK